MEGAKKTIVIFCVSCLVFRLHVTYDNETGPHTEAVDQVQVDQVQINSPH